MNLHSLKPAVGSRKKQIRLGRGIASGVGKTCGRGHKGQKARSGAGLRPGFEGGQMPIYRRLPKRGFNNIWAKKFATVNVQSLNRFDDGAVVDALSLLDVGILKNLLDGVKILGNGELSKKLTVKVQGFTKSAKEKILAAGGSVEVIMRH